MYSWSEETNTITILDLPMGVITNKYILSIQGTEENPGARMKYIQSIKNLSDTNNVRLLVTLLPGAFESICAEYGSADIDPIEDFLMLKVSLKPHLNYYDINGGVLEYGSTSLGYLGAILRWAHARRLLYVERLKRAEIVLKLRIMEENAIIRYVELSHIIGLSKVSNTERASEILRSHNFVEIDKGLLHSPEFTPNDDLINLVLRGPGASYSYILDLKERELLQTAVDNRKKKIATLTNELSKVQAQLSERPIIGCSVWRAEMPSWARM